MSYEYTRRNLHQGAPQHYHYSAIHPPSFIDDYFQNRDAAINCLEKDLKSDRDEAEPEVRQCVEMALPDSDERINTLSWLKEAANYKLEHRAMADIAKGGMSILQRKFEVSKRLRSSYGPNWELIEKDNAPLEAYAYFSFLLSADNYISNRLKEINTILKVNDLIVSSEYFFMDRHARQCLLTSLRFEVDEIGTLCLSKGLQLDKDENS